MTNLPKSLRRQLDEETDYTCLRQVDCQISRQDGTRKYLFALADGNMVESVLMRYHHGNSVCILLPGGMPYGMPLLRLHPGRPGAKSGSVGNAGSDLPPDRAGYRGAGVQRGGHGNRGTAGQLRQPSDLYPHADGRAWLSYQPEERDGLHLRDCAADSPAGPKRSFRLLWPSPSTLPIRRSAWN